MPSDLPTAQAGALEPLSPAELPPTLPALAGCAPDDAAQAPAMAQVTSEATPEALVEAGIGAAVESVVAESSSPPRKGPLSFLTGALTSGLLAWVCLGLSARVVGYYAEHPPHYEAQFAQSIATAMKTLIVGMCFLATFSFAFIGVGLLLTFLRSLRPALRSLPPAASGRPS